MSEKGFSEAAIHSSKPERKILSKEELLAELNSQKTRNLIAGICYSVHDKLLPSDIEDLTQDVMLKANKAINTDGFRNDSTLQTWLFSITRNTVISFLRTQTNRWRKGLADEMPDYVETVDESPSPQKLAQESETIEATMKLLPKGTQDFLRLILQGFTHQEIGNKLGISREASANRLHQIRKKYGEEIKKILG